MPKRIPPPNEPDRVAERWARFMAALSTHEQGHAQNAMDHGKALYEVLRAPHVFPSAEALKNFVHTEGNKCIAEAKAADKEYDRRTGHGATQGATLR
jgi:predicted secreted Zn-dependent protease